MPALRDFPEQLRLGRRCFAGAGRIENHVHAAKADGPRRSFDTFFWPALREVAGFPKTGIDLRSIHGLVLLGLIVRLGVALFLPSTAHADETFQYLEQAYRLASGRGMTPWEFQVGARSWLIPGLLWPFAAVAHAFTTSPTPFLAIVAMLMILASLSSVAAAFAIGGRCGKREALLAGLVAAVWPELVFYAPHILADTLSGATLIGALSLCLQPGGGKQRAIAAGLLLGVTVALRVQLAPAVALAAVWTGFGALRRSWSVFALSLMGPILGSGLLDWATWGTPFQSTWVNVFLNLGGVAASFGVQPWWWYAGIELWHWNVAAPFVLLTVALGSFRMPMLGAVLLVILATFSAVGHKEYRFIYPALPILCCLAGVGTATLLRSLARQSSFLPVGLAIACSAWIGVAAGVAVGAPMRSLWTHDRGVLQALETVNADPGACGLAISPPDTWEKTGLSRLRADIALYAAPEPRKPSSPDAYNYVLEPLGASSSVLPTGFSRLTCYEDHAACLYHRPGTCRASGGRPLAPRGSEATEAALRRTGLKLAGP